MQTTTPKIIDSNGKAVTADEGADGVTLANGTYHVDLGGADVQSVHFEWSADLAMTSAFSSTNRVDAPLDSASAWFVEAGVSVTAPGASAGTKLVSPGLKAHRNRAVLTVTNPGKLLILRRGGL